MLSKDSVRGLLFDLSSNLAILPPSCSLENIVHSLSKTPLTQAELAAIAVRHFPNARLVATTELTEGFYNTAYRLDLDSGLTCVLKVAPPRQVTILRYERNILAAEVSVMRLVRERTSMPVPAILADDASGSIIGPPYYLMDFVPGEALHKLRGSLTSEDQHRIDFRMGQYLKEMNSITGVDFGYCAPGSLRSRTWRSAFDGMLQGVLADGQDADVVLPLPYRELYSALSRHLWATEDVEVPCLVHWDLWDGNIFVDPGSREITGIIDFERALWGDPLMEVNFRTLDPASSFAAGYGGVETSPSARVRRLLYNVYLYLIMVIECTYRQYPTQDQEHWSRIQLEHDLAELAQL